MARTLLFAWLGTAGVFVAFAARAEAPPGDAASTEAPIAEPRPPPPAPVAVVAPRPLETPGPAYPPGAAGDASVVLELTVDKDGRTSDPELVFGDEPFAGAALAVARSWRFAPATRGGEPVAARIRFEVRFSEPATSEVPVTPAASEAPASPAPGPAPAAVAEVTVLGVRPVAPKTTLGRAEVREIPGTFGDPFRAIEVMPGVTPIVSGLPYFFVRGAPPGNVGYYLDGIRVPLLYHFALGPSVIHPGLVDRVDLYAGGYPARYGRYSGGIVAAETTTPQAKLHGEANVRLFDAGMLVEGPIGERGTALAGGRYSYTAGILSLVAPEVTLAYWDYQLRGSVELGLNDTVSVFAFGAYDLFTVDEGNGDDGLSTQFHRLDLRFDHTIDRDTRLRTAATIGYDRTGSEATSDVEIATSDRVLGTRLELEHRASQKALVRAGADITLDRVQVSLTQTREVEGEPNPVPPGASADPSAPPPPGGEPPPLEPEEDDDTEELERVLPTRTDVALGVWGDVVLELEPGVRVTPGLRLDFFHSNGASAVGIDPRIAARFDVSERVSLEHAFGVVHQPPSFVIPIPGFELSDLRGGLQQSLQSSAGVEWRIGGDWVSSLTLFHNVFLNLTDLLSFVRYGDELDDLGFESRSLGRAYGAELVLRRPLTRRFGGYLAYTLSRSERSLGRVHHVASFDRTHVLHAALAFDLGRRWRTGARATFYSGTPSSTVVGERFDAAAGGPVADSRPPLRERAPAFFRLDLRLEKRWVMRSGAWLAFVVEVLNSTLTREVVNHECDSERCRSEAIGPVTIPSIGLEAAF